MRARVANIDWPSRAPLAREAPQAKWLAMRDRGGGTVPECIVPARSASDVSRPFVRVSRDAP